MPVFDSLLFLFWLLAAIDGHAKNFSLQLHAGGTYSLAPLYDIMSAYPLIQSQQLQKKKIKMAMALKGKNNHYHWHAIQRRHFLETAHHTHYSYERAEKTLEHMLSQVDSVIAQVEKILPKKFPYNISDSIFSGMLQAKKMLAQ